MKNCLVKKLDVYAQNDNIPYFGAIGLSIIERQGVSPSNITQKIKISMLETPADIVIEGEGHFTDSTLQEDLGKRITVRAGIENSIYFSPGTYNAFLLAKYSKKLSLSTIESLLTNCSIKVNINDLKHIEEGSIRLRFCYGNIESLSHLKITQYLDLSSPFSEEVIGNFESLGNCKLVQSSGNKYIILGSTACYGEVINFIDTYIKNGSTDTINLWVGNNIITYDGSTLSSGSSDRIKVSDITDTSFTVTKGSGESATVDNWVKSGNIWVKQV